MILGWPPALLSAVGRRQSWRAQSWRRGRSASPKFARRVRWKGYALNPFYRHGGVGNASNFIRLPYRMNTSFPHHSLCGLAAHARKGIRSYSSSFADCRSALSAIKSLRYAPRFLRCARRFTKKSAQEEESKRKSPVNLSDNVSKRTLCDMESECRL